MDTEIRSAKLKVENKQFFFDLRENRAGRYLKITEASGRRSSIIIPADGLPAFRDALLRILGDPARGIAGATTASGRDTG